MCIGVMCCYGYVLYSALQFIESYIADNVLPYYANTHSGTSHCSRQTTFYREEARLHLPPPLLLSLPTSPSPPPPLPPLSTYHLASLLCVFCRDIIRNSVNASSDDCVIFVGSGCTGAVHKLIGGMKLKESAKPVVSISLVH